MQHSLKTSFITAPDDKTALDAINAVLSNYTADALLEDIIIRMFARKIALVSSFGAASITLLHMVSKIAPDLPILFVDTGKLFPESLNYRDKVITKFQLTNVQTIKPKPQLLSSTDPDGSLWQSDPDQCCAQRKVAPLASAIAPYSAWISGRKRYQNGYRKALSVVEQDGDKYKINPLAFWSADDVQDYIKANALPVHPLIAKGYPSIGCAPCTSIVRPGEDERAGRWRGQTKTECGIHFTTNGDTAIPTSSASTSTSLSANTDGQRRTKSWA